MKKNISKGLKLYDIAGDGKGISKKENYSKSGLKRFFISLKDNSGKLLSVNMFMVLGNFPIFFLIAALSGYTKLDAFLPSSDLFQNLSGIFMIEEASPFQMTMYALEGLSNPILVNTTLTYIFLGISSLFLFTFGIVNVGTAYILRNIAMGEPVFVWSDFWYAVKRNWKQALPFGIIDAIINGVLVFNIYTTMSSRDYLSSVMFWGNIVITLLYFFMRPYIYIQIVTFKLTVFKIVKNSLSFALLGLKRNLLALFGSLVLVLLEVLFIFSFGGILLSAGVILPLTVMFAIMAYMKVYASYFKIKEIMIDPYKAEHPELYRPDEAESENDSVIMRDDVTEKEKLEQIKKRNSII